MRHDEECLFIFLWVQWTVLGVYVTGVFILYVLGFFYNLLEVRWLLIPATLGAIFTYGIFSLLVVTSLLWQKVFTTSAQAEYRFSYISALPSIIMLACIIVYLLNW